MMVESKVDNQCDYDVMLVLRVLTSVDVEFDKLRMYTIIIVTKLVIEGS